MYSFRDDTDVFTCDKSLADESVNAEYQGRIGLYRATTGGNHGGATTGGLPLQIAIAPNDTCRGGARVPAQLWRSRPMIPVGAVPECPPNYSRYRGVKPSTELIL